MEKLLLLSANFISFYLDATMFIARLISVISGIRDSDKVHDLWHSDISKLLS